MARGARASAWPWSSICFGAANSLASPYRLLRCLPAVLYEAGVAITVSLSFAPELVMAIGDVRAARRLRGRPDPGSGRPAGHGHAGARACARPLAAAGLVDGRPRVRAAGPGGPGVRRTATGATAVGLLLLLAGLYGVLVAGSLPGGGIPFVAVGAVLVGAGLAAGGRRTNRTRYRPDPWRLPEWLVSGRASWWWRRWWPPACSASAGCSSPRPPSARPTCRCCLPSASCSACCRRGPPRWSRCPPSSGGVARPAWPPAERPSPGGRSRDGRCRRRHPGASGATRRPPDGSVA